VDYINHIGESRDKSGVGSHRALLYIHQVNRVNHGNGIVLSIIITASDQFVIMPWPASLSLRVGDYQLQTLTTTY